MYTVCWIEGDHTNRRDKWARGTYDEVVDLVIELSTRADVYLGDVLIIPPSVEEKNGNDFYQVVSNI